MENGKELRM